MWNGTSTNRAAQVWRTWWVVRRRSREAVMPPCSAMARSRLMTRHTVIHGASHRKRYSSGRPMSASGTSTRSWPATMRRATGRAVRLRRAWSRPRRFFHPLTPTASRRSLRRNDARVTG